MLNVSVRAVSLRAQPLSGSRCHRSPPTAGGPQPCGSATLGSWPWSALSPSGSTPSPASRNRSLRARVAGLLGAPYTANQMGYDLARLRLNGLIERLDGTNTYILTDDGQRVAIFYTKVHDQLLRPLLAADRPPAPPDLRFSLKRVDHHVHGYLTDACLRNAA